jgi:UDP:flavonoid glycosyltransferase YjiC (YdhE family)
LPALARPPRRKKLAPVRVLFASTRGAGHVGPLLPLARACRDAGHQVLVAGPPVLGSAVEREGVAFWELDDPPQDELAALWAAMPSLDPEAQNRTVIAEVFGRLNAAATLPRHREACREWRPDVVVRESSEFGAALAAEHEGIPHARVGIGLAVTEELQLGIAAPAVDGVRAATGLPPDPDGARLRSPYLTWFPRTFEDPGAVGSGRTVRLRDPAWDAPADALPGSWSDVEHELPLVYLTFGSVAGAFERAMPVFAMALEAVAELPVRALLTVGRGVELERFGHVPTNVHLEQWVPQGDVLPHAAAVVCHAGSGTTLGALAAGRPIVAVPMFADQPYNARRVEATGAGLAVPPTPATVREALRLVLHEERFTAAAQALAAEMGRQLRASAAVEVLAEIARSGAALR